MKGEGKERSRTKHPLCGLRVRTPPLISGAAAVELLRSPRAIVFYLVVERMPIVPDKLTLLSREPGPDDHVGCIEQIDELCTLCGVVSRKPSGRIGRFSLYQTRHTTFMRMESDDGQWRKSGSTLDATTPSGGGK